MSLSDANYNESKLRRPPMPKHDDWHMRRPGTILIRLLEVFNDRLLKYQNRLGNSRLIVAPPGTEVWLSSPPPRKDFVAEPSKKYVLWFTQPPYHSVIIYGNKTYALMAVEYRRKLAGVLHLIDGSINTYRTKERIFVLRQIVLAAESRKWVRSCISEAL